MRSNTIQKNSLQDYKINIKIRLSALWVSVMFCYIYGDFFSLFVPGRIQGLMNGQSGAGPTTPLVLVAYAVLMSMPPIMIFLSLTLNAKANRIVNKIAGIFFTIVMVLVVCTSIGTWMLFYIYLGIVEIIITSTIVYLAWAWPKADPDIAR